MEQMARPLVRKMINWSARITTNGIRIKSYFRLSQWHGVIGSFIKRWYCLQRKMLRSRFICYLHVNLLRNPAYNVHRNDNNIDKNTWNIRWHGTLHLPTQFMLFGLLWWHSAYLLIDVDIFNVSGTPSWSGFKHTHTLFLYLIQIHSKALSTTRNNIENKFKPFQQIWGSLAHIWPIPHNLSI